MLTDYTIAAAVICLALLGVLFVTGRNTSITLGLPRRKREPSVTTKAA